MKIHLATRMAARTLTVFVGLGLGLAMLAHAVTGSTPSTTALASSNTSPYVGQSVTLTATVSPSAATGSVTFKDGSASISGCSAVTLSAGVATCTATFSSAATHSVTAAYNGDATYTGSSGAVSEVVAAKVTTTTTVVSSSNPSIVNTNVTITATVVGSNPTGTVTFYSASGNVGTATLNAAGQATHTSAYTTQGSRAVNATYSGDTANAPSNSAAITQVVTGPPATTTTLASSAPRTTLGTNVTLTAVVVGSNNPTGNVDFYSASGKVGTAALVNGQATFTMSWSTLGIRQLNANYLGDVLNAASTSALVAETVLTPSTVALTATPGSALQSQSVTLKATLSPSQSTGTVTFMDGATSLGSGTLASGVATLSTNFALAGSHSLTAVYAGDSNYGASTSSAVTETVTSIQQSTTTSLVPSANPGVVGNAITLLATVTGSTPTGTVQFKDGSSNLGSPVTVLSGQASMSVTPGAIGGHAYSAAYSGDTNNAASSGQAAVNIVGIQSTTSLTASATSATPTTTITLTAGIAGSGPTGNVVFRDGATPLGTVTLVSGAAALNHTLAIGPHAITATYAGDATNAPSTSTAVLVEVSADGSTPPPGAVLQVNYQYDAQGNLTQVVDANSATTQQAYDSLSRATTIVQPAPAPAVPAPQIGLSYDLQDQPATVTDPRSLTTSYTTSGLGDTTVQASPDTGTTNRTFYDNGLLKTSTDARGRVATYTYDALNRLGTISYTSGVGTVFTYDQGAYGIGHLTSVTDESGSTSFGYDGLGHVLVKTQTVGPSAKVFSLNYTWATTGSANGKLQAVKYPSGAIVNYGYDSAGRVNSVSVTGADGAVTPILSGLAYTALSQPQSWVWGVGGVPYQRGYDGYGRLVSYPLGNPSGSGISAGVTRTLAFDAAGRIVGYSHTTPANWDQVFSYDGLDRLTSANLSGGSSYGYAYDLTGNRTQSTINGTAYALTVSATSNQYTNVATAAGSANAQGFDAAGHLTSEGQGGTYTYSDRGRLSTEARTSGNFSYLYDAFEQRTYKSGPSAVITTGTAYYAYDEAGHLIGEYDATGKAVYETVYIGDTPVAALTQPAIGQTQVSYIYADHLNTGRVIVRPADQAIVWQWGSNEPFGQSQANSNPNGLGTYTYNARLPGQVADVESGWFYNWHRDYNPALGRYVQSDVIGLGGGINTYGYVNANPLSLFDLNGDAPEVPGNVWNRPEVPGESKPNKPALKDLQTLAKCLPWENCEAKKNLEEAKVCVQSVCEGGDGSKFLNDVTHCNAFDPKKVTCKCILWSFKPMPSDDGRVPGL